MRIGRLMRTLTPRHARGRGRQHATYRVYVRPIGFTCDLRGPRAAQPHRRSHAMSIHAPSEPAQRCVLERGSVPDSSGTSGHVVVLSKTQFSSHIAARLPKLRYYSPRTIPRLHATTTAPLPHSHDEGRETQQVAPRSPSPSARGLRRGRGNPAGNPDLVRAPARDQCPGQLRIVVSADTA